MPSRWSLPLVALLVLGSLSCGDDGEARAPVIDADGTTTTAVPPPDDEGGSGSPGPDRAATDDPATDDGPATGQPDPSCTTPTIDPAVVVLRADGAELVATDGSGASIDVAVDGLGDAAQQAALAAALARHDRTIRVTVPEGAGPHDVILDFHGYGGDAGAQDRYSRLSVEGPEAGYLVVAVDGRGDPRRWELTSTDTGLTALATSDVAVVDAALDVVLATFCGDPDAVHATGLSNGSVFAAVFACHSSHDVRAVGSVAFTTGTAGCDQDRQVPTVAFHGTADIVVPYGGRDVPLIEAVLGWELEPAEEAMAAKADLNGCEGSDDEPIGTDVLRRTWRDCDADTVLYRIDGGGHGWPGPGQPSGFGRSTTTVDATELILEFFDSH